MQIKFVIRFSLTVCFIVFTMAIGQGQPLRFGAPFITSFSEKDFNVSNQNWDIVQDERGVIYLANDYGVLEFDGTNWNIIQSPYNRSIVRSLAVGVNKKFYVGAQDVFGYLVYGQGEQLEIKSMTNLLPASEKNFGNVWRIFLMEKSTVFFTWGGLFVFDGQRIKVIKDQKPFNWAYKCGKRLFISGQRGVFELKNDSLCLLKGTDYLASAGVSFIALYPGNQLLIGTPSSGLFTYNFSELKAFKVSEPAWFQGLLCGVLLNNGTYLIGTGDYGLLQIDRNGLVLQHITKLNGLGHNRVRQVFEDRDGNWWALNEKGIDVIEASSPFYKQTLDNENPFSVYTIFQYGKTLYAGSHSGLFKTNIGKGPATFSRIAGVGDLCWKLDTLVGKLYLFNGSGLYEIADNSSRNIYSGSGTWTFLRLHQHPDKIIVGTYDGLVLFRLKNGRLQFERKLTGFDETSRVMEEDELGNIWVSHGYKGVFKVCLTPSGDSIARVLFYDSRKGFPSNIFINVFKVANELVFGTQKGIYKYDALHDSMIVHSYYAPIMGLNRHVKYMHTDPLGQLWYIADDYTEVLNMHPDASYSLEKIPSRKLTRDYIPGFENIFFYPNGNALIGTKNGMIFYDRQQNFQPKANYKVIITRVANAVDLSKVVFDERFRFFGDTLQKLKCEIPYKQNSLRFSFTAPYFENIDETEFSYYLEGHDEAWSEWTTERFKEYSNLPNGKYTFRVKARTVFDQEAQEAVFRFVVLPPWYRSTLAYLVYFILLVGAVWLLFKIRNAHFEKEKRKFIEQQERTRSQEQAKYQEEKLMSDLDTKNKELAASAMKIIYKNEKMQEVKNLVEHVNADSRDETNRKLSSILQFIEKELKDDPWDDFELRFDQANNNFIKRLKVAYPDLSSHDLKICAYLRMNLSTKEIAQILNLTIRGVETARFRIRKRMGLESSDNLNDFILSF